MPRRLGRDRQAHRELARWLASEHGIDGWSAQSVTVSYERARSRRAVGEHADGFAITASKTVAVPVDRLYDAFVDASLRERWLPGGPLRERTATKPKSARFDWGDGESRVVVGFTAKGDAKSVVDLEHARLPDAAEAERMKRGGLPALGGGHRTAAAYVASRAASSRGRLSMM